MGIRIEVHDGESIQAAIRRFNKVVHDVHRTRWEKRRRGFYEAPSIVARRGTLVRRINSLRAGLPIGSEPYRRYVGFRDQYNR